MRASKVWGPLAGVCLALGGNACTRSTEDGVAVDVVGAELRPLTKEEARADLETMIESFRSVYAPLERKEERYHFSFDEHVEKSRALLEKATTGADYQRVFEWFTARFHDAHVWIEGAPQGDDEHVLALPFAVLPVGDTFVVYLALEDGPIMRGDELLSIDGVPAGELTKRLAPLAGVPNPSTAAHIAADFLTFRTPSLSEGIEDGQPVVVRLRRANGRERDVTLNWTEIPNPLVEAPETPRAGIPGSTLAFSPIGARVIHAELASLGDSVPFFLTQEVAERFEVSAPIVPSDDALSDFGVSAEALREIDYFAVKYTYRGKRILLVRLPDYGTSEHADSDQRRNYLRALLHEQQASSDALVFDDTHNPGGDVELSQNIATFFASETLNGFVQRQHVDRLWISVYLRQAAALRNDPSATEEDIAQADEIEENARLLNELYDAGEALSPPIALPDIPARPEPDLVRWTKPSLFLTDELSFSGADLVPLLIKANSLAPLFGQRTAGAGGNVETVALLPNSANLLNMTRGSFTAFDPTGAYPDERFVEDNGVTPDIEYAHTLEDIRAGYVGYVEAFSQALLDSDSHKH